MMYESLVLALLATSAYARPQSLKHHHFHHHSGTAPLPTGTGAPFPAGNSTGPYANGTASGAPGGTAISTTTAVEVVTMTVVPLPASAVSSSAVLAESSAEPNNLAATTAAAATAAACAASQSTTTITTTELFTVTVEDSSAASAVASTPTPATSAESSSASSETSAIGGQFYAPSSASSSVAVPVTSYSTSTIASAATEAAASSVVLVASSVASTSSAASAVATTSSSKRGLAYNDVSLTQLFTGQPVSWAYNWASTSGGTVGSGLEYVPMIWCTSSDGADAWIATAEAAIAAGSSHLLSFNEPDQTGECSIDAAAAAAGHIEYMNPLSGKAQLGSPAVTNGGGTMGLNYLSSFFSSCAGACDVDFINIHWYNSYSSTAVDDFKTHVTDAITLANTNNISKVWVTEFALNGADAADTATFLGEVLPWLDSNDSVERYAFFMCADGLLTSGDSISSQIGAAYVAA